MGKHKGDCVQCPYHGLQFGGDGACMHNPHGDGRIPKAARVRSYPVAERFSAVWIWMGDPQRADPDAIPDFSCMDPDRNYVGKRYLHARAHYMLENDNILDLSHIEFLHPSTLGSSAVRSADFKLEQCGDTLWARRQTRAEVMSDFLYEVMRLPRGEPVDRWFDVRWNAPSNLLLVAGATPAGKGREEGTGNTYLPHLFTPETETSTHYWYATTLPHSAGPEGAQIVEHMADGGRQPFVEEDLPMLEAQQKAMDGRDFWDMRPILLAGDAAAIRARRILEKLIRSEADLQA
jgi:vanillate O-demethylase monooxygenase subunit